MYVRMPPVEDMGGTRLISLAKCGILNKGSGLTIEAVLDHLAHRG